MKSPGGKIRASLRPSSPMKSGHFLHRASLSLFYSLTDPNDIQLHLYCGIALPAVARDKRNPHSGSSLKRHQRSNVNGI
jgi:hypothetical protein